MRISKKYSSICVIALTEFKQSQIDSLSNFMSRYRDSLSGSDLQCAFNCVHLYEKAENALKEISKK